MTPRCKTTGKVIYRTKEKATRGLRAVQGAGKTQAETMHAYRCEDQASHWHIGHNTKLPGSESGTGERVAQGKPPRWNTVEWDAASMTLWSRSRDLCESPRCGRPLGGDLARHHRQRRQIGGDRLSNLVALHTSCHEWTHAHPEEARELGLIVSSHAPDPELVPLSTVDGKLVTLHDDGTKEPHRP